MGNKLALHIDSIPAVQDQPFNIVSYAYVFFSYIKSYPTSVRGDQSVVQTDAFNFTSAVSLVPPRRPEGDSILARKFRALAFDTKRLLLSTMRSTRGIT